MGKVSFFERLKQWAAALLGPSNNAPSTSTSATPPPVKPTPKQSEPYVFVTVKGKKYHWDRLCPCLRNANEIKMDLSKARKAGYTACDKCCYNYLHD